MYRKCIKRIIDLILSFIAVVFLAPVFLIIILLIRLDSPGPALFTQKRVGKGKTFFNIYKFRTMQIETLSHSLIRVGMMGS